MSVRSFRPVSTALDILDAVLKTSPSGEMKFNNPPYEYEYNLMPFDILSGDSGMRETLKNQRSLKAEKERWASETEDFIIEFSQLSVYSAECLSFPPGEPPSARDCDVITEATLRVIRTAKASCLGPSARRSGSRESRSRPSA